MNAQRYFFFIIKEIKLFNKFWQDLNTIHEEYVAELIEKNDKLHMNLYRYINKVSKVCQEIDEALNTITEVFEVLKKSKGINQTLMDNTYIASYKLNGTFEKMETEFDNFVTSIRGCRNHIRQEKVTRAHIENIKLSDNHSKKCKTRPVYMVPQKETILTDIMVTVISLKRYFREFSDILEDTSSELQAYVDNLYKINLRTEMVSTKIPALDFSDYYIETQAEILINNMKPLKRYFSRIQAQISQHKAATGAIILTLKK